MKRWMCLAAALLATSASAAIPQSQRDALLAFYQQTGGNGWIERTGWNGSAGSECDWYGVRCDEGRNRVLELSLPENGLTGSLPSSIAGLPDLEVLTLFGNPMSGPLPAEIGQLARLETFSMQAAGVTGALPDSIAGMTRLRQLELRENDLSGSLPEVLGSLPGLEWLDLSQNRIGGTLPPALGQLARLVVLDLGANQIEGNIPPELGGLSQLEALRLTDNALNGSIPTALGSLSSLLVLDLSYNGLTGAIPSSLGNLRRLEILDLSWNALDGSLPLPVVKLPALRQLHLGENHLEGELPDEIWEMSSLEILDLSGNGFGGQLPAGVADLTRLTVLSLAKNHLSGEIPPEIGSLPLLEVLDLRDNLFDGAIPEAIGSLTHLTDLDLAGNQLTGWIPASLGSLSKLTFLALYSNDLEGTIPPQLGALAGLEILYLSSNRLTGVIPDSFRDLTNLRELKAASNRISGTIPYWIGELSRLIVLDFGSNQIAGSIPESIGNLTALEELYLDGNRLSGAMPSTLGNLSRLTNLGLGYNGIGGEIPSRLWELTELVELRLNDMELIGELPLQIGNQKSLLVLSLENNDLEGTLPRDIGGLIELRYLDLDGNRFRGSIPRELGQLVNLLQIDLSNNRLEGALDPALRGMTALEANGSDFGYNALFAEDESTRAFINAKQRDGDFESTQTLTPAALRVAAMTDRSAVVEWNLISYTEDDGGYQVAARTSPDSAPVAIATTGSKDVASIVVRGLQPSTTYWFTVSAVTHPHGYQRNLLASQPSAAVSGTTSARVIAPPQVVVTDTPRGLVQVDAVLTGEDAFRITNFGDVSTSITLSKEGDFFTIEPRSFALAGGASQVVNIRGTPQPAGTYYGWVGAEGAGVAGDVGVTVSLLSVRRPEGRVAAEPLATRIEVAGAPGSDSIGAARFRNVGTASLTGIVLADQPWVVPSSDPITIEPGEIGTVNFRVVRANRPSAVGALAANLSLIYVDQVVANAWGVNLVASSSVPGISISIVTVVDVSQPAVSSSTLPPYGLAELGLFLPGVMSVSRAAGQVVSDLSLHNRSGSRSISDLRLYFTPSNRTTSKVATLSSLPSSQSVSLINLVSSVYDFDGVGGSLQIRSSLLHDISVSARLLELRSNGVVGGDVPLFRSDRSAAPGQQTYLAGVVKSAAMHTDLFIQETSGEEASVTIELLRPDGTRSGEVRELSLDGFAMVELPDEVPANVSTVIVTNSVSSSGRIAAYGRVVDETSGDHWSIVDWSRVQRFQRTEPVRLPLVDGRPSRAGIRRRAVGHGTEDPAAETAERARSTTALTLFNPGETDVLVGIEVLETNGRTTTQEIVIGSMQTRTLEDLGSRAGSSIASAIVTPKRGEIAVTARSSHTAGGTYGASVPVVAAVAGLRLGQFHRFSGISDASARTVASATPGTQRTTLVLVESSTAAVTVRASIVLDVGRGLTSAVVTRDFALGASQQVIAGDLVRAILGEARETQYGDLHDLQLELEVIQGSGSVVPFLIVTDKGSGESLIRLD